MIQTNSYIVYYGFISVWYVSLLQLQRYAASVDFYNILNYDPAPVEQAVQKFKERSRGRRRTVPEALFRSVLAPMAADSLDDIMNNEVKDKLGIIPDHVIWGGELIGQLLDIFTTYVIAT